MRIVSHFNVCITPKSTLGFEVTISKKMSHCSSQVDLTTQPRNWCFVGTRADQKTGGALLEFSGRTGMHGKSCVSSAINYDRFKLDDSGNCIIRKTWLHCI